MNFWTLKSSAVINRQNISRKHPIPWRCWARSLLLASRASLDVERVVDFYAVYRVKGILEELGGCWLRKHIDIHGDSAISGIVKYKNGEYEYICMCVSWDFAVGILQWC